MQAHQALGEGREPAVREPREVLEPPIRVLLLYAQACQVPDLMECLSAEGYEVIACPTSAPQERWMADLQPDLVLLLPPADEVELVHACEIVRDATDKPLLVLSDQKEELLIARALASGVDEYLVTPMGNRELVARIEAMLRRIRRTAGAAGGRDLGALRLAPEDNTAVLNGRRVSLSPIEFRLLACLASTPGEVVTHQTLMSRVWGEEYVDSRNYLRLYIRYLREKLEEEPTDPQLIVSEWGVGYRLQLPETSEAPLSDGFVPAYV